jgi:hypothetical protein
VLLAAVGGPVDEGHAPALVLEAELLVAAVVALCLARGGPRPNHGNDAGGVVGLVTLGYYIVRVHRCAVRNNRTLDGGAHS